MCVCVYIYIYMYRLQEKAAVTKATLLYISMCIMGQKRLQYQKALAAYVCTCTHVQDQQ